MDRNQTGQFWPEDGHSAFLTKPRARARRRAQRERKAQRKAERVQLTIRFHGWADERKNRFQIRRKETPGNTEVWDNAAINKIARGLLHATAEQVIATTPGSALYEECAAWLEGGEAPLPFRACCDRAGEDPEDLRHDVAVKILARAATAMRESSDAVKRKLRRWIEESTTQALGFERVCELAGWPAERVRKRI